MPAAGAAGTCANNACSSSPVVGPKSCKVRVREAGSVRADASRLAAGLKLQGMSPEILSKELESR